MYTEKIVAKTTKTADKSIKTGTGTVELYEDDELQELEDAGLLPEHREMLNSILVIRAQDEIRRTLVDDSPEKVLMRKVKALLKTNPDAFKALLADDSDIIITK